MIQDALRQNCSSEFALYKTGVREPGSKLSSIIRPVIVCILDVFDEKTKVEMASSAVLLGLLPMILQTVGSNPIEIATVGLRRPILGFLLAGGSPAITGMKSHELIDAARAFADLRDPRALMFPNTRWGDVPSFWRPWMGVAQYLVTAGAVANVMEMAYKLGVHGITAFTPETIFAVPTWCCLGLVAHIVATLILYLSLDMQIPGRQSSKLSDNHGIETVEEQERSLMSRLYGHFLVHIPMPAAYLPQAEVRWTSNERAVTYFLSWLLSFGSLVIMIFGTLVFSSLLFYSVSSAVRIVLRFVASATVVRIVVRMELRGMNDCFRRREDGDGEKQGEGMMMPSSTQMLPGPYMKASYQQVVQTAD